MFGVRPQAKQGVMKKTKAQKRAQAKATASTTTAPGRCAASTPKGKSICFAYNKDSCNRGKACKFAHVCGACFGTHPMFNCKGQAAAGTSGPEQRA